MKMPAKKNSAVMLSAALAIAGCDGAEKPVVEASAPVVQVAVADELNAQLPTVVERRHFAIYNTYRVLFDDASNAVSSPAVGKEGGLRAVAALDHDVSTCSIHTLQPQD